MRKQSFPAKFSHVNRICIQLRSTLLKWCKSLIEKQFSDSTRPISSKQNYLFILVECCLSYWSLGGVAISKINEIDVRRNFEDRKGGTKWVRSLSSIVLKAKVIEEPCDWCGISYRDGMVTQLEPKRGRCIVPMRQSGWKCSLFSPSSSLIPFLDGFQRTTWPIDSKSLNLLSFPRSCNDFTTQSSASLMHWSIQFFFQSFQSFTLKERLQWGRDKAAWKKQDRKTYFNLSIKDNATSAVLEIYV